MGEWPVQGPDGPAGGFGDIGAPRSTGGGKGMAKLGEPPWARLPGPKGWEGLP